MWWKLFSIPLPWKGFNLFFKEKYIMVVNIASKKVVRIKPTGSDFIALSWLYQLREHNNTKKIYDVDPFIEVYKLRDNLYGLLSDMLDTEYYVWMYLIVGPEKAMLIDTSFGHGNLKGLCHEITGGKPLIVANTHCGPDHSYGNCQFERTYDHVDLVGDLNWKQDQGIWDYLFKENGKSMCAGVDKKDMIPFKKYEVIGVPDGHTFNLGKDYDVELVWLPGHQAGHSGFLDKKGRILIAGDAITGGGTKLNGGEDPHSDPRHANDRFQGSTIPRDDHRRTVTAYRDGLLRLSKRLNEFDYVFGGHGINDLDNGIILNIIEACNEIIANPECYDFKIGDRLNKLVRGWGSIGYYRNGV
jgi:glyoxylase-like metal-dependent hydrolase (beta-lactamase superfamily II)